MPNYKKRSPYQTGGATKPMQPKQISQAQMNAMSEAAGRQALGNRQRAAAQRQQALAQRRAQEEAMRQRQAQAMRQREQQLAAMRQQRTPARAQDLRNTPRKLSPAQQRLLDSYNRGMARKRQQRSTATPRPTNQQVMSAARQTLNRPATPRPTTQQLMAAAQRQGTPQKTPQARPTNSARNMAERRRIQQQIAQLQARLRQLGG